MTDYVKSTNFASKDSLASGNPLKIVKGTEIDAEFNNIATAVGTKADLASPVFTGTPAAPTASVNTNTTQVATTAFVVTQIADDAPTKTGTGASGTWGIDITGNAATVTNGVYTTGDQTLGGTKTFTNGIRFNDATVQTTSSELTLSAGSLYTGALIAAVSSTSTSTTFNPSKKGFIVTSSGTVRAALTVLATGDDFGNATTTYVTVYKNGSAVGTTFSTVQSGTSGVLVSFSPEDLTVASGDTIQVAVRKQVNTAFISQAFLRLGTSNKSLRMITEYSTIPYQ